MRSCAIICSTLHLRARRRPRPSAAFFEPSVKTERRLSRPCLCRLAYTAQRMGWLPNSLLLGAALIVSVSPQARADEATLERVVVAADRFPDATAAAPFSVTVVDAGELARAPQLRLDDIL